MRALRFTSLGIVAACVLGWASAQTPPPPTLKPPVPASPWVSKTDEALLRTVFDAMDRRRYSEANMLRAQVQAPVAKALADWVYLRSSRTDVTLAEIDSFLDQNYGWPNSELLQRQAEDVLEDTMPAGQILAFFDERDPLTGSGHLHLARAFLESGNEAAARAQVRTAWVDYNWSSREERDILSRFGRFLTEADHWAKADRQLFEIQATITERLLPYLPPDRQAEARVRIGFLKGDRNAATLYTQLPNKSVHDSGVLLAATRYYRRLGQEDQAMIYAGLAPLDADSLRNPERWLYERQRLARWALKTGRFEDAYTLSAYSGLESGADFAEAEFMAGWVALRFLNDAERAKAHFAYLGTGVTSPISRARGEYWLARAWAASGDEAMARQHYRVAAAFPFTFYGQLAIDALGKDAPVITFPVDQEPDAAALTVFESRPLVHAMRILAEIGESTHYDRFARALDDQIESPGEVSAYHDLVMEERKTYLAVRAGKVARNNGAEVPSVIFPLYPVPDSAKRFVEEPLILGLSRQESEFNPRAYSSAKARGVMQLLASTARITARKEGLPYSQSRLLDDPAYNITLGAAHLSHLLERFNGSYILVLAGYNAGPNRSDQWIARHGDPRNPNVDPIDWIELIPFSETRNYVMRVIENTNVYRARINNTPLGSQIMTDLLRGGNKRSAVGAVPPAPMLLEVSFEEGGGPNILNRPSRRPAALDYVPDENFPPLHGKSVGETD